VNLRNRSRSRTYECQDDIASNKHVKRGEKKLACKPGSVFRPIGREAIIHLAQKLPFESSDLPGDDASHAIVPLFGLALDGVYTANPVTRIAVSSYLTFSPLPKKSWAVYFLLHCPSSRDVRPLTGIPLYRARTFLRANLFGSDCPRGDHRDR
jgi:hypothetical protein